MTDRNTERETERQKRSKTERQKDRKTERQIKVQHQVYNLQSLLQNRMTSRKSVQPPCPRPQKFSTLYHKFRQTERQIDRKTDRQKDRKTERQIERQTERQIDKKTERQIDRKTERQKDRQTDRQYLIYNLFYKTG